MSEALPYSIYTRTSADGPEVVVHNPQAKADGVATASVLLFTDILAVDEEGMPTALERLELDDAGDAIEDIMLAAKGQFVGKVTSGKTRTWLFYLPEDVATDTVAKISRIMQSVCPHRELNHDLTLDPSWEEAATYFPPQAEEDVPVAAIAVEEEDTAETDRVQLLSLLSKGAVPTESRELSHKASFDSREDARAFRQQVEGEGFIVTYHGAAADDRWHIHFKRNGILEEGFLMPLLTSLHALARQNGGRMDSWAAVFTPPPPKQAAPVAMVSTPPPPRFERTSAARISDEHFASLPAQENCSLATASLVLSLIPCLLVCPTLAIVFGVKAKGRISRSSGTLVGGSQATAGIVIGTIFLLLQLGSLVIYGLSLLAMLQMALGRQ
jgi:hypothetical protein